MSAKTLFIATVALAATAAAALPSMAAGPNGPGTGPGAGAGGPPAMGQPDQPRKMPLRAQIFFNLLDRNGDGAIEKDELDVVRDAIFASLDADGDGKLTKEELRAAGPMMGGGPRGGPGKFQMGRGDDGQRGGWHRHEGGRHGPDRQGQNEERRGPRDGMMGRMGFNGGPGQDDAQGPHGQNFASLDTNGDGVVSQDEFAAAPMPFHGLQTQKDQQ